MDESDLRRGGYRLDLGRRRRSTLEYGYDTKRNRIVLLWRTGGSNCRQEGWGIALPREHRRYNLSHFERVLKSETEFRGDFTVPMNRIVDGEIIHDCYFNVVSLINGNQGPGELFINEESLPKESIFCQPSSTLREYLEQPIRR
jgi:hypothetical protein